jgi:hypothetical protein
MSTKKHFIKGVYASEEEELDDSLSLRSRKIQSFGNLKKIKGGLGIRHVKLDSLDNIEYVKESVILADSTIKDLGNLTFVAGSIHIYRCEDLKSLDKLEIVGGSLSVQNTKIEKLDKLKYLGSSFLNASRSAKLDKSWTLSIEDSPVRFINPDLGFLGEANIRYSLPEEGKSKIEPLTKFMNDIKEFRENNGVESYPIHLNHENQVIRNMVRYVLVEGKE